MIFPKMTLIERSNEITQKKILTLIKILNFKTIFESRFPRQREKGIIARINCELWRNNKVSVSFKVCLA